jgi:hypothetical protein
MTDIATEGLATQWAVIALVNALNGSGSQSVVLAAREEALSNLRLLGDRPSIDVAALRTSLENIFGQAGK